MPGWQMQACSECWWCLLMTDLDGQCPVLRFVQLQRWHFQEHLDVLQCLLSWLRQLDVTAELCGYESGQRP